MIDLDPEGQRVARIVESLVHMVVEGPFGKSGRPFL
jgi:hypothetical protein